MAFASSVSPARRAELRRLRAAFESAYDAMAGDTDPSTPAFRAADARYRAWIGALDAVALALLDDVDAFEAGRRTAGPLDSPGLAPVVCDGLAPAGYEAGPAEFERLFAGLEDLRRSVDLIGQAPGPALSAGGRGKKAVKTRARDVVGHDRTARHWSLGLGGPT